MAKTPNEYIAISPKGKSEAFMSAYADMQDEIERHRAVMRDMGETLLACAKADGFVVPAGKSARIVASRFDGALQIMLSDAAPSRRTF
jgi:esterase/lipase superfamily enzyme